MCFRPPLHIVFPTGDVEAVEVTGRDEQGEPRRFAVEVNFMGLYGPSSPMATHFSESFLWAAEGEAAARAFVDLFHHRMISFVFRAWLKYRHSEQFDPGTLDALMWGIAGGSLFFLALLGILAALAGGAPVIASVARVTFWGALAMALTAGVGPFWASRLISMAPRNSTPNPSLQRNAFGAR